MKAAVAVAIAFLLLQGCQQQRDNETGAAARPDIIATNAFYYYKDVDRAWAFYRDTLGFETVADYGFAKILRLAESSYLTLVDAESGMHSSDEAKTVTLNLITDTLSPWYEHLSASNVDMQVEYANENGGQSNSFVAIDPEGYFLRFVRFNPHPQHAGHIAPFAAVDSLASSASPDLSIRVTAMSAYFADVATARDFYESLFAMTTVGEFDGQSLYQVSSSGFVILVDGSDDLLHATAENGVTLSFLTTDIDAWFARATAWPGFELRTPEILDEGGLVRVFVGYDPSGIFLEWDTFLDLEDNATLMRYLNEQTVQDRKRSY